MTKKLLDRGLSSNRDSFAGSVRQMLGLEGSKIFPALNTNSPIIACTSLGKPLKQLHLKGFQAPAELLQISTLSRPEYLTQKKKPSPKALSPKALQSPKLALDLDALDQDIREPLQRDEDFTLSLEVQTKQFESKIDNIVENDTYLAGFRNVEVKRNKNPNSLNMYAKDFEMKMARIEDSLEEHMQSVGEQILMADENKVEEYEKSKRYHPLEGIGIGSKVPKTYKRQKTLRMGGGRVSPYSEIKEINLDILQKEKRLPKILKPIKPYLDPHLQVKQDLFLTSLARKDFITKEPSLTEDLSSINDQNFQFSSIRSQQGEQGDITNLKHTFLANLQQMQQKRASAMDGEYLKRDDLGVMVEEMVEQEIKDAHQEVKEEVVDEEPVSPTRRGKEASGEVAMQPRDPTEALEYHSSKVVCHVKFLQSICTRHSPVWQPTSKTISNSLSYPKTGIFPNSLTVSKMILNSSTLSIPTSKMQLSSPSYKRYAISN
ncbi:hypothetical protein FGO68_gene16917 [Halteria grandinella]|uniref:Uncharacterized protein n=1 Tax=Halteria grandinella TaxID=5974 RepID=A0A8J8SV33_HALGN|nr:hypothetical protein FGO68_gene16917 [Halteria grandinella]